MQVKHLFLTITLLLTLSLPNFADAQQQEDPIVRLVYFLPKGHKPASNINEKIDPIIKGVQEFYADQLERHGFGRKTFRLETDETGQVVVHRVNGKFHGAHYAGNNQAYAMSSEIAPEVKQQFDVSDNIYLILTDFTQPLGGYALGKFIVVTPTRNPRDQPIMIAHELGHSFKLGHDFRSDAYIMSYGPRPDQLSECAASWLDVHRFFNAGTAKHNTDATIQMLPPTFAAPDGIRLRFQVNDPEGAHQANLLIRANFFGGTADWVMEACQRFEHGSNTIEVVTNRLINPAQDEVTLYVIDKQGGTTWEGFPIDISAILPPPDFVSIPDPNLAAALRERMGLAKNEPISQRALRVLAVLHASDRHIQDLSGLEHATQLKNLYLGDADGIDDNNNNVSDITPLKNLKHLRQLWLADNNVSDITPLKNMTSLEDLDFFNNNISDLTPLENLKRLMWLRLSRNPVSDLSPLKNLTKLVSLKFYVNPDVSDITALKNMTKLETLDIARTNVSDLTPLKNMTELKFLGLDHNNISNITPLLNLTGLETLYLQGNPIKNHARLLTLLKKNPDMKIYLKEGGEPLPVTLSSFLAELTGAGVVLKWVTQSEVDNAGFYIYRSETRDDTFKLVTPQHIQGAGTTSQRHTYTWTDTTAKPNIAYYYQIEDISHAGVRKRLATVRMRGFVSANGKLTKMWADLKRLK